MEALLEMPPKTRYPCKTFYQYQISTLIVWAHINIACIQTLQTFSFHLQISYKCPARVQLTTVPHHCTIPPRSQLSLGRCTAEWLHAAAPPSRHTVAMPNYHAGACDGSRGRRRQYFVWTWNRMQQTTCCSICTVNWSLKTTNRQSSLNNRMYSKLKHLKTTKSSQKPECYLIIHWNLKSEAMQWIELKLDSS